MRNAVLSRGMRWLFRRQRFPGQLGDEAACNIKEIVEVVWRGAHSFLNSPDGVSGEAERFPWHRQEFFWEGVALGQAAESAFSLRGGNPDERRTRGDYRAMHYTGYGFWAGLARRYPLPGISLRRADWAAVADFARYGPFMAGGVGFGVVCTEGGFGEKTVARLKLPDYPGWTEAALHGCGRALWFLFTRNMPRLDRIVAAHPRCGEALLEGIGVAIAFTQLQDAELIWHSIQGFAPQNREAVARGATAAILETQDQEAIRTHLLPSLRPELRQGVEAFRRAVGAIVATPEHYYAAYVRAIRAIRLLGRPVATLTMAAPTA